MSAFPCGCFGKLPLHGDFIRYNAAGAEVAELDQWIQEGIYQGNTELADRWDATFDAAPHQRFIYISPRTRRAIAGLFRPSVDRAGRRYPFLVYALLDGALQGTELPYLPWALPGLASRVEAAVQPADSLNALMAAVDALRFEPDMGEARRSFGRHVLLGTAEDLWRPLGGANDPRAAAALHTAAEGPACRPPVSLLARLPLSGTAAAEGGADVSFWLELIRRLSRDGALPTLTAWTASTAHFCFGELKAAHFLPVVLPGRVAPGLRDLSVGDDAAARKGAASFGEVLASPSLKLSELLQRLPRSLGL